MLRNVSAGPSESGGFRLPTIKALFWDVGGVLLSNAWDRKQREATLEHFGLDEEEFSNRHEMVVSSFERGKIGLDEYLDRTVFYRPRRFTREEFKNYMMALSQPIPESLAFALELAKSGRYLMGTINNESRDLNLYRIEKFGLREIFDLFLSSCYVGLRKPEEAIYRLALDTTQQKPGECCFIDDRALNLEAAHRIGMHTIEMDSPQQLRQSLAEMGVAPAS
jgi:putative hydrolase of the HAD superfamily